MLSGSRTLESNDASSLVALTNYGIINAQTNLKEVDIVLQLSIAEFV